MTEASREIDEAMLLFDAQCLTEYRKDDVMLRLLRSTAQQRDAEFTSHQWLLESLPKRMIYYHMYKDLLERPTARKRILDVGGGYTSLSRLLVQNHDYFTLDMVAHDSRERIEALQASVGREFWIDADWHGFEAEGSFDLVIANDLFPNVDQRLGLFLEKYLPVSREVRMSLTYHNVPRWYKVKRVGADEILHVMSWDGLQVQRVLEKYVERIHDPQLGRLLENPPSLFANGRQVCRVALRGDGRCSCKP